MDKYKGELDGEPVYIVSVKYVKKLRFCARCGKRKNGLEEGYWVCDDCFIRMEEQDD